jgi:hypothetical protein
MQRQAYATDLSDAEWAILEPPIPGPLPGDDQSSGAVGKS